MSGKKAGKILTLRTGETYPVLSEDGRYYYCGMTQFRKENPMIVDVSKVSADRKETKDVQQRAVLER